jgi:hypothetical protein
MHNSWIGYMRKMGWYGGCESTYVNWYPRYPDGMDSGNIYVMDGQWSSVPRTYTDGCGCENTDPYAATHTPNYDSH